jgi:hypothetical protein
MPRVFLGNFDFEHELAAGPAGRESPMARQLATADRKSELFWTWLPIAGPEDFVVAPDRVDLTDFAGLSRIGLALPQFVDARGSLEAIRGAELIPWGWTGSLAALGRSHGWKCPAPPLDVVRHVNSRAIRIALETELNVGLRGAALVNSADELQSIVMGHENSPRGWLLKANFGMSGRETLRGRGTILDEQARNWAQKRLAGGPIVFEPIVERIAEAGIQIHVPQTGPPQVLGITPLLVDRSGVYRGSRFGCPARELEAWQGAVDIAMGVAARLQSLGCFGPLGIDAMQYRDDAGEIRLRPLQDLNARFTMGRLALGFARLLPSGWCGSWLHFHRRHLAGRGRDAWLAAIGPSLPPGTITAITSPRRIGSQPVEHHAVLVMAAAPEALRHTEAVLFENLGIATEI